MKVKHEASSCYVVIMGEYGTLRDHNENKDYSRSQTLIFTVRRHFAIVRSRRLPSCRRCS